MDYQSMDMDGNYMIEKYAVRIAVDNGEKLKGSGLLYTSNPGKYSIIFTAAHVIYDGAGKVYNNLYLSFKDINSNYQVIKIKTKHVFGKETTLIKEGNVYIHSKYSNSPLNFDAAIICIPWSEWMSELQAFRIGECKTEDYLIGYGFPESMNKEWTTDRVLEHGGKDKIAGTAMKHTEYLYSLSFDLNIVRSGIKIENVVEGFSGTGLFVQNKDTLEFTGVISKPRGEGTSQNTLWVCSAKTFLDIMDEYSLNIVPPSTFEPYIARITETFAKVRQPAKDYFVEIAYKVIKDNILPEHLLDDSFLDLKCDGERKLCEQYFLGQFKKCIILYLINGNEQIRQKPNMVIIPAPYNESVCVEFLCSEAKAESVIADLVNKNYFAEQSPLNDGTIFLWNGGIGQHRKNEEFKRCEFRAILTDIADGLRKNSNMHEVLKLLSSLLKSKEYKFDIVEGELQEINFALVGIEKFLEIIENNKGDDIKTKSKIGELLKEIWEI